MGFRVWVPPGDCARVLELRPSDLCAAFLTVLPVNFDDNTQTPSARSTCRG